MTGVVQMEYNRQLLERNIDRRHTFKASTVVGPVPTIKELLETDNELPSHLSSIYSPHFENAENLQLGDSREG